LKKKNQNVESYLLSFYSFNQMENQCDERKDEETSGMPNLTPVYINRARILPDSANQVGGVIQPVNPHFSGYNVVIDIENEDPDVQWIPNPGFVPVVIAEEEAVALTEADIAAINVAPERILSTDDERPASSYPL